MGFRARGLSPTPRNDSRKNMALPKICLAHLDAAGKLVRSTRGDDPAFGEDVSEMGNGERLMHVLLDQKNGDAAPVDLADGVEVLFHQQGREAERWLVDEEKLGC